MGLLILPVAFALIVAWTGLTLALAAVFWRVVRRTHGRMLGVLAVAAVCSFSLVAPNAQGILDRRQFERISQDCGWTVMEAASGVDEIFIDADSNFRDYAEAFALAMARKYRIVEFRDRTGAIRVAPGSLQGSRAAVPARTPVFAIVFSSATVGNYRRDQVLVINQSSGAVLARNVEYWPERPQDERTVVDYAWKVITVQPKICQVATPVLEERVMHVLVPTRKS